MPPEQQGSSRAKSGLNLALFSHDLALLFSRPTSLIVHHKWCVPCFASFKDCIRSCLDQLYPTSKHSQPLRLSYLISICLQPLGEISTRQTIIRGSLQSGALDVVPVNAPATHVAQVCTDVVLGVILPGARGISVNQYRSVRISHIAQVCNDST